MLPSVAGAARRLGLVAGAAVYDGPLDTTSDEFGKLWYRFAKVLGAGLGGPIAPITRSSHDEDGSMRSITWQRPFRPDRRSHRVAPVGRIGDTSWLAPWIEGALLAWDDDLLEEGLEIALLYNEDAPDRPELEMRCRDATTAIERLATSALRARGITPNTQLRQKLLALRGSFGHNANYTFTNDEVATLHKFRTMLAHEGDLGADGTLDAAGTEDRLQVEG